MAIFPTTCNVSSCNDVTVVGCHGDVSMQLLLTVTSQLYVTTTGLLWRCFRGDVDDLDLFVFVRDENMFTR